MHTESVNISQGKRRSAAATTVVIEVPALPIDIKTPDAMWRKKRAALDSATYSRRRLRSHKITSTMDSVAYIRKSKLQAAPIGRSL